LRELQNNCLGSMVQITALRKKIRDLSDPSGQRKRSIFSWFLTGLAFLLLSSAKVTMVSSTKVSRKDSLIFLHILDLILFRFTEFPSELKSNTLLRQRTHFTVRFRKKHVCILLQITSVTNESTSHPSLVCDLRWFLTNILRGCYLYDISRFYFKNFVPHIFVQSLFSKSIFRVMKPRQGLSATCRINGDKKLRNEFSLKPREV
jgi:hypothetical protein